MKFKKFGNKFILRIDRGEEIIETVKQFCIENDIKLGSISGIGAANEVTVGLFDPEAKQYHSKKLTGDYEIVNLSGNISTINGELYTHFHINLSDSNFNSYGGHLNSAVVSSTCEIIIDAIAGELNREFDEETGLNLFKI